MISDPTTIQRLALRSDLPRLSKEGFHLFAQLEGDEQKLSNDEKARLLAGAYVALVAHEERNAERPLPALVPRSYRWSPAAGGFEALDLTFDLAEPFERRRRDGTVLGVARHLRGHVRLYMGAFAYFTIDDLRPLDALDDLPGAMKSFAG